jgi:hypothetical protein
MQTTAHFRVDPKLAHVLGERERVPTVVSREQRKSWIMDRAGEEQMVECEWGASWLRGMPTEDSRHTFFWPQLRQSQSGFGGGFDAVQVFCGNSAPEGGEAVFGDGEDLLAFGPTGCLEAVGAVWSKADVGGNIQAFIAEGKHDGVLVTGFGIRCVCLNDYGRATDQTPPKGRVCIFLRKRHVT